MTPLYRRRRLRWLFLLLWRLREREVADAREGETKGPPEYQYGKVTGLEPDLRVISETGETPYVCCGYCSAAMAVWTARKGVTHSMSGAAHPIRSQGGRPHNNGSKASELRAGASEAHGVKLDALAVSEIPGVLRDGFAVVVNLDYAQLPAFLRVQGGSFGHSATLYGWQEANDRAGFFDPLWPEGAYGAWAPWTGVRDALWGDGEHSGTVVSWAEPPPEPEPEPECPDCPPPEVHDDAQLAADLARAELVAAEAATVDRDRAWRWYADTEQPRIVPATFGGELDTDTGASWSRFARFGPEPPPDSWNGPATTWDATSWR